jgi:hypothetical protein
VGISFVGANTAVGDNHVDMEIILNKKQIQIGEPLVIDFKLDPRVPNTPFNYGIYSNAGSGEERLAGGVINANYSKWYGNEFTGWLPIRFVQWFTDNTPSGSYTISATFGPSNNILAKAEMDFTIQNDENNIDDILRDKYLPGTLDIGTKWKKHNKIKETVYRWQNLPADNPCYYFTCKSGLFEKFSPDGVKFWLIEFTDDVQAKMYSASQFKWDECPDGYLSSDCSRHVYVNNVKLIPGKYRAVNASECTTVKGGGFWDANYDDLIKCHYKQFVVGVQPTGKYSEINDARILVSETLKKLKSVSHDSSDHSSIESELADTKPVAEKVSEPIQKASTECDKDYTFVDGMCTKQKDERKLGDRLNWNFSDALDRNPKLSVQVKLIDPSGKIIQDRFVASHGKLAIEFPETGMVGDYQLIWQYNSGSKVIWQVRHIIPIVGEEQQSSGGCGEGTVLVNGTCQLAPTQSKTSFMSIEPLYIIIGVVAIGGIIGAIAAAKRGSKTSKPAKQDLDEYEEQYLAKQKPSRKPVEKEETSTSCDNCGNKLKPTAKFCGSCGTPRA